MSEPNDVMRWWNEMKASPDSGDYLEKRAHQLATAGTALDAIAPEVVSILETQLRDIKARYRSCGSSAARTSVATSPLSFVRVLSPTSGSAPSAVRFLKKYRRFLIWNVANLTREAFLNENVLRSMIGVIDRQISQIRKHHGLLARIQRVFTRKDVPIPQNARPSVSNSSTRPQTPAAEPHDAPEEPRTSDSGSPKQATFSDHVDGLRDWDRQVRMRHLRAVLQAVTTKANALSEAELNKLADIRRKRDESVIKCFGFEIDGGEASLPGEGFDDLQKAIDLAEKELGERGQTQ